MKQVTFRRNWERPLHRFPRLPLKLLHPLQNLRPLLWKCERPLEWATKYSRESASEQRQHLRESVSNWKKSSGTKRFFAYLRTSLDVIIPKIAQKSDIIKYTPHNTSDVHFYYSTMRVVLEEPAHVQILAEPENDKDKKSPQNLSKRKIWLIPRLPISRLPTLSPILTNPIYPKLSSLIPKIEKPESPIWSPDNFSVGKKMKYTSNVTKFIDGVVISTHKNTSGDPTCGFHYTIRNFNEVNRHITEEIYPQKSARQVINLIHQTSITSATQATSPIHPP